jgi:hypothetical protein
MEGMNGDAPVLFAATERIAGCVLIIACGLRTGFVESIVEIRRVSLTAGTGAMHPS